MEYALGTGLIVVTLLGAINHFQDGMQKELQDKQSAGAPDTDEGVAPTLPPVSTSTIPDGGSTTTVPAGAVSVSANGSSTSTGHGNKWIATVNVTVTDTASGSPMSSVNVTGNWTNGASGGGSCITVSGGTCTLSLEGTLNNGTDSVSFEVTSVSGEGVIPPGSFPSVTVYKPGLTPPP